jgi:hypothetical protein
MKTVVMIAGLIIGIVAGRPACADEQSAPPAGGTVKSPQFCVEVISCGTKDGTVREYPTPCAARDDGATNIAPKTGATCGDSK